MSRYIDADVLLKRVEELVRDNEWYENLFCADSVCGLVEEAPTIDAEKISDGYHTFADLYEQRLVLSAALAKNNPRAWKSKLHSDGTQPFGGGWFVVGWETEDGDYTYHYELKDWDLFDCKELDRGKEWDGHTSNDVRRLLSMPAIDAVPVVHGHWVEEHKPFNDHGRIRNIKRYVCSNCGRQNGLNKHHKYCPNCGAKMTEDIDEQKK